jgi:hypothetical protein
MLERHTSERNLLKEERDVSVSGDKRMDEGKREREMSAKG